MGFVPSRDGPGRRAMAEDQSTRHTREASAGHEQGFVPSRDGPGRRAMPEDQSTRHTREASVAERVGFEPTVGFPLHTLSKRAPSTTRTSLHV